MKVVARNTISKARGFEAIVLSAPNGETKEAPGDHAQLLFHLRLEVLGKLSSGQTQQSLPTQLPELRTSPFPTQRC